MLATEATTSSPATFSQRALHRRFLGFVGQEDQFGAPGVLVHFLLDDGGDADGVIAANHPDTRQERPAGL